MITRVIRKCLGLLAAAVLLTAASLAQADVTVKAVSPRIGMLFADNEKVQVGAQVTGAVGATTVEYTVVETEGPYKTQGRITAGAEGAMLPLQLPGRGHYVLTLAANGARSTSTIAIVFPPAKPEAASPWGVCWTPPLWWGRHDDEKAATDAADSMHMLGASWVRALGVCTWDYGDIKIGRRDGKVNVTGDPVRMRLYLKGLRSRGLYIFGGIYSTPTILSSRPTETSTLRDSGELRNRVKPRDYAEMDSLVTNIVAEFRKDITYWEIWNEANQPGLGYWSGTPDEFLELVEHTSKAIRAGNPDAKIIGSGFVHVEGIVDNLLAKGIAKNYDILSVHYVNDFGEIQQWKDLLKNHNLTLPIWDSEERVQVPTIALANGVERHFNFMHVNLPGPAGEGDYGGLCNTDFTVRPTGVWFSVGAHCIGSGKAGQAAKLGADDYYATHFTREREDVLALTRLKDKATLEKLTLNIVPLNAQKPVTITDRMGHSENLVLKDGRVQIALENRPMLFVNGAAAVSIIEPK